MTVRDSVIFAVAILLLGGSLAFIVKKIGLSIQYVYLALILVLIVVLPLTFIGVVVGIAAVTAALIAISEEVVRALLVKHWPRELSWRWAVVFIATLFGIIETTNWIFVDKARVALADQGVPEDMYLYADLGYISVEFVSGFLLHGILSTIMVMIYKKGQSISKLIWGGCITVTMHFLINSSLLK